MQTRHFFLSILVVLLSILAAQLYAPQQLMLLARSLRSTLTSKAVTNSSNLRPLVAHAANMSTLSHATLTPRLSADRGHADHGWLNSYHTFSFASYMDPRFTQFGALRVLNEDRVTPENGFPTHHHKNFEIFSYILSGELTHRDSMGGTGKDDFFVMKRGDLQFTTGGTGISHSEYNMHKSTPVHFLQIWVKPWAQSLPPTYHTATFADAAKREGFVTLLSPLKGGPAASKDDEKAAVPLVEGTVPIHADFMMGAAIVPEGQRLEWKVGGGDVVTKREGRNVYVHVPMTKGGKVRVKVDGRVELGEGDGCFVKGVKAGDGLGVEALAGGEAEVVVLDSD